MQRLAHTIYAAELVIAPRAAQVSRGTGGPSHAVVLFAVTRMATAPRQLVFFSLQIVPDT
ncbi:hypothetical protein ASD28_21675 [Massilia sp. Root133]|nr:hypothetical protein ASD28_21675 [Massilia sp. Root133]